MVFKFLNKKVEFLTFRYSIVIQENVFKDLLCFIGKN